MQSVNVHDARGHDRGRAEGSVPLSELAGEVLELAAGVVIMLLPLMLLSVPAIVLFVVGPAALLGLIVAAVVLVAGIVLGPPVLLLRALRRRRAGRAERPAQPSTVTLTGHNRALLGRP
jgi:Flp pilus assembly protein TadB